MLKRHLRAAGHDIYFLMADLCAALFALWAFMFVSGTASGARALVFLAFSLLLLALFSRKRRDEFAEHCWRTATSATFLMLIIAPIAWAFIDGLIEGFSSEHARDFSNAAGSDRIRGTANYQPSFDGIVAILFATFFITFEWTRFRGGGQ